MGAPAAAVDRAPLEALVGQTDADSRERRLCFAACHVVLKPGYSSVNHSARQPGRAEEVAEWVDWEATGVVRKKLDALGFGIAEAMDTAQRFELGWASARRLIELCGTLPLAQPWVAGAGSDQASCNSLSQLVDAVVEQVQTIQSHGGSAVLLPQVWLVGRGEETTVDFYRSVVEQVDGPLIVHWLGEMFAPQLAGYFPGASFRRVLELDPEKVRGAKISLLDAEREVAIRREMASRDQLLFTGDDWNFPELIGGEGTAERTVPFGRLVVGMGDFSHALLGVLGPVARPASLALELLARGHAGDFRRLMNPCAELGRRMFEEPTSLYKCGVAFLSWLSGAQENAQLVNHLELERPPEHYEALYRLACEAGTFSDAELAADRYERWEQGNA
ncbi:MAG: DUF993 family protein [Acidobacteriota bacterium]